MMDKFLKCIEKTTKLAFILVGKRILSIQKKEVCLLSANKNYIDNKYIKKNDFDLIIAKKTK